MFRLSSECCDQGTGCRLTCCLHLSHVFIIFYSYHHYKYVPWPPAHLPDGYTFYSVSQERIMDEMDEEAKRARMQGPKTGANWDRRLARLVGLCVYLSLNWEGNTDLYSTNGRWFFMLRQRRTFGFEGGFCRSRFLMMPLSAKDCSGDLNMTLRGIKKAQTVEYLPSSPDHVMCIESERVV